MIAERIQQQSYTSTKYYQFATILEHVIDCFHTIVSDETNPYHPPLAWLTRKQPKPPEDELFLDLMDECRRVNVRCDSQSSQATSNGNNGSIQLSSSVRARLERCPLDTRREIVSRIKDGCAPLFVACKNGFTSVARYLIEVCRANIEQEGHYEALEDHRIHSVTPIWVGSVSGHLEIVRLLIEHGANVNSLSDTGSTPLRSVCFLCKDDDYNSNSNEDVDDDDDGINQYFAEYDILPQGEEVTEDVYMKIVQLLLENGADIHRANYGGGTCLINSIHNYKLIEYILDHGADINATDNQSKTALHYAIQQDRIETVKLLISRGADPFLRANFNDDDALQLCCIKGHERIFDYLIGQFSYSPSRLADAHKLIGSSILELHYDLARVRRYWTRSLELQRSAGTMAVESDQQQPMTTSSSSIERRNLVNDDDGNTNNNSKADNNDADLEVECDIKRSIAFGDMEEFRSEQELASLSVEDFRIQSLIISERILGLSHRETIQRLLYRGTFYINSLRPNRCIDLWLYALKLRLDYDSIFHFESIFAAQAITKLFLDLFGQQQPSAAGAAAQRQHHQQIKFCNVYDVLTLLVGKLDECKRHLSWKPSSCLHEDIFDLLLGIIVNLLLALKCITAATSSTNGGDGNAEEISKTNLLIDKIIKANPKSSSGLSLLHICVSPSLFESDVYRCFALPSLTLAVSEQQQPQQQQEDAGEVVANRNNNNQSDSDDDDEVVDNDLRPLLQNVAGLDEPEQQQQHRQDGDDDDDDDQYVGDENPNLPDPRECVIEAAASSSSSSLQNDNNNQRQEQQQQTGKKTTTSDEAKRQQQRSKSPIVDLIETLLTRGLEIDQPNENGLSALQMLCLSTSIRASDKTEIVRLLIDRGAHVDRRTLTPEQGELIRGALREAGVNPLDYTTLACLAARKVAELGLSKFGGGDKDDDAKKMHQQQPILVKHLRELIAIH